MIQKILTIILAVLTMSAYALFLRKEKDKVLFLLCFWLIAVAFVALVVTVFLLMLGLADVKAEKLTPENQASPRIFILEEAPDTARTGGEWGLNHPGADFLLRR
jgi:hypothetical protein